MVVAALAAGAGTGLSDTAKTAVVDAYQGLKALVKKAFDSDEKAAATLTLFEDDPTDGALVGKIVNQLTAHHVADSPEVRSAAQRVLDAAGPSAIAPGSVAATVLQITAERGGVAAATITGSVHAGYSEHLRTEASDPS